MDNLVGNQDPPPRDTALLIIDVLNDMEFDGGEDLHRHAESMVDPLRDLRRRCKETGLPVIYVNDNFGCWRSDAKTITSNVCDRVCRGQSIARDLAPDEDDYFVLKPKHSGFHYTPLAPLLDGLGVKRLILTGVAGNICVLFTANDALMHGYTVIVPGDCIASESAESNDWTLRQLSKVFGVDTRHAAKVDLGERLTAA